MSGVTPIYHITDVDNLGQIVESSGLWCDAERLRQGWTSVGIAHQTLKARRAGTPVPAAVGGTLGDYVPFYFANRSPMLYAIHTGFVDGYQGTQRDIIYLVSSVEQAIQTGRAWCFTDGHPVESVTRFYDDAQALSEVDWDVIGSWSWRNRDDDLDRKRRKQAEFLVHESFSWEWVERIGVIDLTMAKRVGAIIAGTTYRPRVCVEPKWYY